jgi:hypothetical protein
MSMSAAVRLNLDLARDSDEPRGQMHAGQLYQIAPSLHIIRHYTTSPHAKTYACRQRYN